MRYYLKYIIIGVVLVAAIVTTTVLIVNNNNKKEEQKLAFREEGIAYFDAGDYEKALTSFQSALDIASGKIGNVEMDVCFYKARAQFEMGDTEGAVETYTSIIEHNDHAKAYFLRGNLYYSLGEEEKALADYEKAAENEDKDYELYIGIYEVLESKDKMKEGQAYLNKALEIDGNKATDKIQKGYINFLLGEYETAIGLLEDVLEKETIAYYYLFQVYDAMEDSEKAVEYLNTYMEKEENIDSTQLYEMGKSLLNKEQLTSAIECFNKALELEKVPNQQVIMRNLVVAYEKNLDFASAKEVMKAYVEAYPEDEEALREYTFLQTR